MGVTILTSLNNKSLKEIGHTKNVKQLVLKQAALIKKSGLLKQFSGNGVLLHRKIGYFGHFPHNWEYRNIYREIV